MVIQEIGIIGSGAMGGGIAQLAAQNGFSVVLEDRKDSDLIIEAVTENDYEISRGCARRKVGKKERRGIL